MIPPKLDPPPYVFRDEGNNIPLQPTTPNFVVLPCYYDPPQPQLQTTSTMSLSDSKNLVSIVCCFASTFLIFIIFFKIIYTLEPA
jgi:hypothetical protein